MDGLKRVQFLGFQADFCEKCLGIIQSKEVGGKKHMSMIRSIFPWPDTIYVKDARAINEHGGIATISTNGPGQGG